MSLLSRLFRPRPWRLDFHPLSESAQLPAYATKGASGLDLFADENTVVPILGRALVKTNVAVFLPEGFEAQVRARSGLAAKHGITVLNGIGTIDSDYRGGLGVILFNAGDKPFEVKKGDRIAQLVIARYERVKADWLRPVLDESHPAYHTERGTGGFGSTGTGALVAAGIACASMTPDHPLPVGHRPVKAGMYVTGTSSLIAPKHAVSALIDKGICTFFDAKGQVVSSSWA